MDTEFRKELASLINKHSMENGSNTPDFILAQFLTHCLRAFDFAIIERNKYYNIAKVPSDRTRWIE